MKLASPELLKATMRDPRRNFSHEALARRAGCSKAFISHLTSGRKTTCRDETATRIAEALSVPLELLFVASSSAASGRNDCGDVTAPLGGAA